MSIKGADSDVVAIQFGDGCPPAQACNWDGEGGNYENQSDSPQVRQ